MGVTGLWKLIDGAGKQVTLESLEGKTYAIDASILLNQALKGMKDQPNAHIHVLFLRLCKLLTYKIKPIFVFDGGVPVLKRQTIAARQRKREEATEQAQSVAQRLKRKAVQKLAIDNSLGKSQPSKQPKSSSDEKDLFELPPLPQPLESEVDNEDYHELPIHNMLYSGDIDLQKVDINSEGFKALPLEYQHEILEEVKEYAKHNAVYLAQKDVSHADDFSSFQIARLVKSSKLSNQIEGLRKEMLAGLADQADDADSSVLQANRVMSEDTTHYLLLKTNPQESNKSGFLSRPVTDTLPSQPIPVPKSEPSTSQHSDKLESHFKEINDGVHADWGENLSDEDQEVIMESVEAQRMLLESMSKRPKMKSTTLSTQSVKRIEISDSDSDGELEIVDSCTTVSDNVSSHPFTPQFGLSDMKESKPLRNNGTAANQLSSTQDNNQAVQETIMQRKNTLSEETINITAGERVPHSADPLTRLFNVQAIAREPQSSEDSNMLTVTKERTDDLLSRKDISPKVGNDCEKDKGEAETVKKTISIHLDSVTEILESDDETFDDEEIIEIDTDKPLTISKQNEEPNISNPLIAGLADEILESTSERGNIHSIKDALQTNHKDLQTEYQKHQALAQSVTQQMVEDAVELLRLFGIPYVVSPSEAEAQCAKLEQLGMCNGIITEDSDVWLFGASAVLKNFFQQDKNVISFTSRDILRLFGLDREKLIALALVCGSDYTDGIAKAGPVTAIEIISEFGGTEDGITALKNFREWLNEVRSNGGLLPVSSGNTSVRNKLRRLLDSVPESFPNSVIVDAYMNPSVDDSSERFEWGRPDLDLLRQFAHKTLNWNAQKVDDLVCPVIKKMNSTETQSKLSSFFSHHATSINTSAEFQSNRLKSAISKLVTQPSADTRKAEAQPSITNQNKAQPVRGKSSGTASDKTLNGKKRKSTVKPVTSTSAQSRKKKSKTQTKNSVYTSMVSSSTNRVVKADLNLSEDSDSD